jgi:dolichyl-phosphate beta-glucosyltransferase
MLRNEFLTVVVPVYNEHKRMESGFANLFPYLQKNFMKWEVIYVDDGSTDQTYQKLLEAQSEQPGLRIIRNVKNAGKGNAVRRGLEEGKGDILLFSDADFSSPIEEAEKLLDAISSGYDIAIASRGMTNSNIEVAQHWMRETMGKVFNLIIRTLLPLHYQDTQCGFKMFRREAARSIVSRMKMDGFAFDVEMLVIAQVLRMKVIEIPITWRDAKGSKVHPIKSSLQMFQDVIKIRYRLATGSYS